MRWSSFGDFLFLVPALVLLSLPSPASCYWLLGCNCCLLLPLRLLLPLLVCLWCQFFSLHCRSARVPACRAPPMLCCGPPVSPQCQTARFLCFCWASAILSSFDLFLSRVWTCFLLPRRVHIYFYSASPYFSVCFSFFRLLFHLPCQFCHVSLSVFVEGFAPFASAGSDVKEVQSVPFRRDRVVGAAQSRFGPCYPG